MAFGVGTFNSAGAAVQDLFNADAQRSKAQGQRLEAQEYDLASGLTRQNEEFTKTSTAIKEEQENRSIIKTLGSQQAEVASSGFAESGSALDILRESQQQGALTKNVLSQQGLITEAGYEEQARSYNLMSQASNLSADASEKAANNSGIMALVHGAAAVGSLFV